MPGLPVYQDSASQLKTQIFVQQESTTDVTQLIADDSGRLIITTNAAAPIAVEATDLDIRDLTNATDSVAVYGTDGTDNQQLLTDTDGKLFITTDGAPIDVQATDLDIRDLTNATDSVSVYGTDGSDNVQISTDANGQVQTKVNHTFTNNAIGSVTTANAYASVAGQNISNQTSYSFYVANTGVTNSATLKIQLSPDNTNWVDDGTEQALAQSTAAILTANRFLMYIRLSYKSTVADASTTLSVIFQAQT